MYSDDMPYAFWYSQVKAESNQLDIPISEFLAAFLDRLEESGRKEEVALFIHGLDQYARQIEPISTGRAAVIREFSSLMRCKQSESDYIRLQTVSASLLETIGDLTSRISRLGIESIELERSSDELVQSFEQIVSVLKMDVLQSHSLYFQVASLRTPGHLGYRVKTIRLVERLQYLIRSQLTLPFDNPELDRLGFSGWMIGSLLDWNGDYAEMRHLFWRQELNDIMGI